MIINIYDFNLIINLMDTLPKSSNDLISTDVCTRIYV